MSQTRAREVFGLSAADLQANISRVIDQTARDEAISGDSTASYASRIKLARFPRVSLTVRLVTNPRGYYLPMRLYKVSELEQLSALKRAETPPAKPLKKAAKRVSSKRKRSIPSASQEVPNCLSNGHNFKTDPDGMQQCETCGQRIEIEEI